MTTAARLAILGLLALAPLCARAECRYLAGGNTPVTFNLPTTISVPSDLAIGQVIPGGTSAQAAPADAPVVTCGRWTGNHWTESAETLTYGVINARGGYLADNVTYDTGVAGIGYRITHPTKYLTPYPLNTQSFSRSTFSVTSGIELIKTGPIVSGSILGAGKLADWRWGSLIPETFRLANAITFTTPSCKVLTNPINVALPPVLQSQFAGVGATSGRTAFSITLSCPTGTAVRQITLHAATPAGYPGVIAPAGSGYAAGIGVQILDRNINPVTFETQSLVAPGATASIAYYAQYFQTAAATSAGPVKATVTFDLFYQ
jgi:type 1 fimbria pilin